MQDYIYREYVFKEDFPLISMTEQHPTREKDVYHFHNCLEICYCESRRKFFQAEGREFSLNCGDACIIPPYNTHASFLPECPEQPPLYRYLFFDAETLLAPFYPNGLPEQLCWYKYDSSPILLCANRDQEDLLLLRQSIRRLREKSGGSQEAVRGLMQALLVRLSRARTNALPGMERLAHHAESIWPAVEAIKANPDQDFTMEQLAERCRVSTAQFASRFQVAMGNTPQQYLRFYRVRRACELLLKSESSILEISLAVGFQSSSSFYYNFRKMLGTSPEQWRNNNRVLAKGDALHTLYDSNREED
ncbi:MAG: AraC family transcriptional regulator [Gemmiger sp.]|nr:AraC family transcriptional regulator [Gemmiger sp.]